MENTKFKPLPPWSEMPDWAMFRAVDSNGRLCVFTDQPTKERGYYIAEVWHERGDILANGYDPTNWETSLESRPETQDAPELVVDAYGIKGTTVRIVSVGNEWVIENGKMYMLQSGKYSIRLDSAKRFTTPQAAAEYWMAQNEKK